jgi:hypothetical protein
VQGLNKFLTLPELLLPVIIYMPVMKKYLLSFMLIAISTASFSQSAAETKIKLVGKWLLVKHTLTEKGKTDDLLTPNEIYTFDFAPGGNYQVSYVNKKNASTTVYQGKWQVTPGGKKLKLFDNTIVPAEPGRLVADRLLPIISLSASQFVTKELLFGMDLRGTSYYRKQ